MSVLCTIFLFAPSWPSPPIPLLLHEQYLCLTADLAAVWHALPCLPPCQEASHILQQHLLSVRVALSEIGPPVQSRDAWLNLGSPRLYTCPLSCSPSCYHQPARTGRDACLPVCPSRVWPFRSAVTVGRPVCCCRCCCCCCAAQGQRCSRRCANDTRA